MTSLTTRARTSVRRPRPSPRAPRVAERRSSCTGPRRNIRTAMQHEIMMYGIAQKEGLGLDKAVEECKFRMSRYGVTPNMLIIPPQVRRRRSRPVPAATLTVPPRRRSPCTWRSRPRRRSRTKSPAPRRMRPLRLAPRASRPRASGAAGSVRCFPPTTAAAPRVCPLAAARLRSHLRAVRGLGRPGPLSSRGWAPLSFAHQRACASLGRTRSRCSRATRRSGSSTPSCLLRSTRARARESTPATSSSTVRRACSPACVRLCPPAFSLVPSDGRRGVRQARAHLVGGRARGDPHRRGRVPHDRPRDGRGCHGGSRRRGCGHDDHRVEEGRRRHLHLQQGHNRRRRQDLGQHRQDHPHRRRAPVHRAHDALGDPGRQRPRDGALLHERRAPTAD